MKKLFSINLTSIFILLFAVSNTVTAQLNFLPRGSQAATVIQRVGITDITISYSRPSVNGREVWGTLVPYGMNNLGGTAPESPWRAGANENTVFTTTHDIMIEGKPLPAGTYGLHMVIHENNTATIIFSNNYWSWGSYAYDPTEDVLRVDVETKKIPHVEQLAYTFENVAADSVVASLNWAEKQVPFKIGVNSTQIVLTEIRHQLEDVVGFSRQSWEQAANFALNNGGDLEEALDWVNIAIEGRFFSERNFNNLQIKSQILEKQGKLKESKELMEEAIPLGTVMQVHNYGRRLTAQNKHEEALEIFKWNAKKHKGVWPVDYGLASGYSGVGNYKSALKYLKIAKDKAPNEFVKNAIKKSINKLEEDLGAN